MRMKGNVYRLVTVGSKSWVHVELYGSNHVIRVSLSSGIRSITQSDYSQKFLCYAATTGNEVIDSVKVTRTHRPAKVGFLISA